MKKKVICIMCKKKVLVDLIPYGGGYIWVCPECKKLSYNAKDHKD